MNRGLLEYRAHEDDGEELAKERNTQLDEITELAADRTINSAEILRAPRDDARCRHNVEPTGPLSAKL